ncbi:MAG TPA: VTT domain-containing protein [Solirubrobacteraceae bacterium]|nr:VTT domain-containing protein [Solirubrobacteraceae bacterium]
MNTLVASAIHLHLHLHLHFHRFHGPPFDYAGLAIAASLSWIAGVGPGEPLLVAAAILAAKHKLDLTEVMLVAWVGATLGGVIGWLVGYQAGRAVLTARGPLRKARLRAVERGEKVFERATVTAVILSPSWLAGINHVPWTVYLPANALSAAIWALVIGLGSFLIGPPVADAFGDLGTIALIILGVVILGGGAGEFARRRIRDG